MKDFTITFNPRILFNVLRGLSKRTVLNTDPDDEPPPPPEASEMKNWILKIRERKWMIPGYDDDEIQNIPAVFQIRSFTNNETHSNYFYAKLQKEYNTNTKRDIIFPILKSLSLGIWVFSSKIIIFRCKNKSIKDNAYEQK